MTVSREKLVRRVRFHDQCSVNDSSIDRFFDCNAKARENRPLAEFPGLNFKRK
jgi:hypothetical protein